MSQLQKVQAGGDSSKALKPLSLRNPQSEQSWGPALPRLKSFTLILQYQFIGRSGAAFFFLCSNKGSSPLVLIPIPGAVSNLRGGMGASRAEIFPFSHR